ncbi:HK97 family phage prohead protease [Clostridium sp. YIM B02500]|uniref:HK97 family phage prohead protease n=1 Tax=Clostridium sp. YIM B02500 TaxID=2910681 RepID=UPI001EEE15A0|nr:HK97 family phage prohead protease [Clostridium sp. YIM B02500]
MPQIIKQGQREIRTVTSRIELRSVGEGDNQQESIEGYALKFNKWSDTLGFFVPFREKIMPGALDDCDMSNVVALFNHSQDMPLGRNTIRSGSGSLNLNIDGIGLNFNCIPTSTSYANDLKENIRSNVVNQCSFAFDIDYDDETAEEITWNEKDQIYERTINKIKTLYDVSVVTTPAYPDTEAVVGQRCKEKIEELRNKKLEEAEQKRNKKIRNDELRKKLILKTYL